jgi:type II secretion system protein N
MTRLLDNRVVRVTGYGILGLGCVFVFAFWTFPWERVRDAIVLEVERPMGPGGQRRPSGMPLEIGELSPAFFDGVTLENVRFALPSEDASEPAQEVFIESVDVDVSLLSLLVGNVGLDFDIDLGGGAVVGEFLWDGEETRIAAELVNVSLRRIGPLRAKLGLPIGGNVTGTVELAFAEEPSKTNGSIALTIDELWVGDGQAKLKIPLLPGDGLTIERINAGTLRTNVVVEEGMARVEQLDAQGPDLELRASGEVRIAKPLRVSRPDLLLRVKFTDAYRERNDRTRGIFSLVDLTPQLRSAKTSDGALQYRLAGTFSRLSARPAGAERSGGSPPPRREPPPRNEAEDPVELGDEGE